jgi:outer membrane murein-binding lipoprotein Lpp
MKRTIAVAVAIAAVLVVTGVGATATSSPTLTQFRALQRQVGRLDNQVDGLQNQVNTMKRDVQDLLIDVFGCTFPGDPLVSFSDGSYAYVLYYDVLCTSAIKPSGPGRQPAARAG